MQSSGSLLSWAEEPEVQRPWDQVCFGLLSYNKRSKGGQPSEQAGEERSGLRENSLGPVHNGPGWSRKAFSFYSKLVENDWKVLSRVFYFFIFASMCHPRSSD